MATTKTALQNNTGLELNYVLIFEGFNKGYCVSGSTGITTAYAATEWTDFIEGLDIFGEVSQEIRLFEGGTKADSITFTVLDVDNELRTKVFREADTTVNVTTPGTTSDGLGAQLGPSVTSFNVQSATAFSTGSVFIGHEKMNVGVINTGVDHSFATVTRGENSIFGTESDAEHFGLNHRTRNTQASGKGLAPQIQDGHPRTWFNRRVGLYVHHKEAGAWSTKANAHLLWCGRIQSYTDLANGKVSFECLNTIQDLKDHCFSEQMTGQFQSGIKFDKDVEIRVGYVDASTPANGYGAEDTKQTITATNTVIDWWDAMQLVSAALQDINDITTPGPIDVNHSWDIGVSGEKLQFRVTDNDNMVSQDRYVIGLSGNPDFFDMLGLTKSESISYELLETPDSKTRAFTFPHLPLSYFAPSSSGMNLYVEQGGWIDQPADTKPDGMPSAAAGFIQVGDVIYAVNTPSIAATGIGTASTLGWFDATTRSVKTDGFPESVWGDRIGQGTGFDSPPQFKQVWIERSVASDILLKLLLSTGSSGYNHSQSAPAPTYDAYSYGVGIAKPHDMFDIESFNVFEDTEFELFMDKPTPFMDILEPLLAAHNRYTVWKNGKITLVSPGLTSPSRAGLRSLTEANKASSSIKDPQRTSVSYSAAGLINRISLEYAFDAKGKATRVETVEASHSISDYGQQRAVRIKGKGITDGRRWREEVAAPAMAYFSRPLAVATRTIDHSLMDLVPGEAVVVTDNAIVDPKTGTRGVANFPAWVLGVRFDWSTHVGEVKLAFLPEVDWEKIPTWSPCMRIDSASTTYGSAISSVTVLSNEFSHTTEDDDVTHFDDSDAVRIVNRSPATPGSPSEFYRTISSTAGNVVTFSGGTFTLVSGEDYIIEHDDVSTVQASQRAHAFVADDSTLSTGYGTDPDPYFWGHDESVTLPSLNSVDYTKEHAFVDTQADDQGEPWSVRKAFDATHDLNNLFGVKTCVTHINDILQDQASVSTSVDTLVYGPVPLPYYAAIHGGLLPTRSLMIELLGAAASGTGTFTVKTTSAMVKGASMTSLSYPTTVRSVELTTASSTDAWISGELTTPLIYPGQPNFTWLTIEAKNSGTGATTLDCVHVREKTLAE